MTARYTARASAATVLTTELNSLANNALSSASSAQDNDTAGVRYLYAQAEIYIAAQGTNRSSGAYLAIYIIPEVDGTNYGATTDECAENYYAGAVLVDDGALAARFLIIDEVRLPPGDFKVALRNGTGQSLASSGNTVKLRAYSVEDAT